MAITLSTIAKQEKNKLNTDSVFLVCLKIILNDTDKTTFYIVRNTEDITFNGQKYQAFPFNFGQLEEDNTGSNPDVSLNVDNTSRVLGYYLENGGGGVNSTVYIQIVNSKNLSATEPEVELMFKVTNTKVTYQYVTFTLSNGYPNMSKRPFWRYLKDSCPFPFKGVECGYTGSVTTCGHCLSDCRARGNSVRFGGEPAIDSTGVYV